MKNLTLLLLWAIAYLVLISASNYLANQNIYVQNYSLIQILTSNISMLIFGYCLFCLSNITQIKSLYWLAVCILYLCIFAAFSEIIVYKYSGVGYTTMSFLHFEVESLMVGFNIYPFEISVFILVLIIFIWGLTKSLIAISKKTLWILLITSTILFSLTFFGTAIGRLSSNYLDFINKKSVPALSIEKVKGYEKFGIKPVHYTNREISAEFLNENKKKNVIIIYMESFSHFFTTNPKYPNLTPNLADLSTQYQQLENYHSTAGFTIQGLMSSMCGFLPEMLFENDNLNVSEQPYQALSCLPDVLHHLGYHQEFIGGARKTFSNKERFLINHKFNKVWGWLDYNKDDTYKKNDWGLQDDDLFDFALKRILKLNEGKSPFHISLLNLSTHLSGNPAPSCPKYTQGSTQHKFLDGIHCLDFLIGDFINQLKEHDILDNTVVYLTSDHGVFDVSIIKNLFGSKVDRHKLFGLIIDEQSNFDENQLTGLYDLAPNIIKLLGIKTNITFINGLSFQEVEKSRLLLRKGKLRQGEDELTLDLHCHNTDAIAFPLDKCEQQNLLNLSYGHAESFTTNKELINILSPNSKIFIRSSTSKSSLSELNINTAKQDDQFYNEGFRINKEKRHEKNHLFALVYDLENKAILQRRAFVYQEDKVFRLARMLNKLNDNYAVIFFTDGSQNTKIPKKYVEILVSLGANKLTTTQEPYIAIVKKTKDSSEYYEWVSKEELDSVSVFLKGLNDSNVNYKTIN